jgi:hypothetical protein
MNHSLVRRHMPLAQNSFGKPHMMPSLKQRNSYGSSMDVALGLFSLMGHL